MNKSIIVLLCCIIAAGRLYAQPAAGMAMAEKYSGDSLNQYVYNSILSPQWLDKGSSFYYSWKSADKTEYFLVDPTKKKRSSYHLPTEKPKTKSGTSTGTYYSRPSSDYWKRYSDDSTWYVYGYRHDVYLQQTFDTIPYRLTNDGEPYYSFVSSNSNTTDDKKTSVMAYWMKNSNKLVAIREDKRKIGEMSVINSLSKPMPTITTYKFPVPGQEVVKYELFVMDAATKVAKSIDIAKYPDQKIIISNSLVNGRVHLFAGQVGSHEKYVYFLRKSRAADKIDLCRLDANTGTIKEIISETCTPHINEQLFTCKVLNDGEDILWWSERTGYGTYYLYDKNGKQKAMLGKGDFVSGEIYSIDNIARTMIVEGYGIEPGLDPYYRMYFKINLDGTGYTLLTPGNGYHDISVSPDQKYLVDTYSRMDAPATHVLRDAKGNKVLDLGSADISDLLKTGWQLPELVTLKAADNKTDLYGILYKPFNLDSTLKYPVISNVYPGPQDDLLPRRFTIDDNYNQSLAQLGAIVITFAYRGSSPYRGKEFYCYGYGNLRDYPLADDKWVIEQLMAKRSYMDSSKIGIYGHSGGGFLSATALLTYPDFYKVAVAASGNYDSNIYTQWWGETFHGTWQTPKGFISNIPTTVDLAGNLKGKLFLITGDVDRNVHPAQTFRLVDALIKKNKRFDMMVLPGKDHGLGDKYYINLIRYYFMDHLISKP